MKFPRNARIFRGQLDAAPFMSVFFLLVMFLLLGSLLYTPGVRVQLPRTEDLPGPEGPTISVALDANGRFYFENQLVSRNQLSNDLAAAVARNPRLTLVVLPDKAVTYESIIRLSMLATQAGIRNMHWATLPRVFSRSSSGPTDSP